jgi:hypothetical protein
MVTKWEVTKMITRNEVYTMYVQNWVVDHWEGEPADYEEWLDNEFQEILERFLSDLRMEYQLDLLWALATSGGNVPIPEPMQEMEEGIEDLELFYKKVDKDNFNENDEIWYENEDGKNVSCSKEKFVEDFWDLEEMKKFVNDNFNWLAGDFPFTFEEIEEYV